MNQIKSLIRTTLLWYFRKIYFYLNSLGEKSLELKRTATAKSTTESDKRTVMEKAEAKILQKINLLTIMNKWSLFYTYIKIHLKNNCLLFCGCLEK